jgi:hypothetical protein
MSYFPNINPKQALETLGLRREETTMSDLILPALAVFGVGLTVGAVSALLLTPKTGRELRGDLSRKANELKETVRHSLPMRQDNGMGELDH